MQEPSQQGVDRSRGRVPEGSEIGGGRGGPAALRPHGHESIKRGGFVVDGEKFCRLGYLGVGPFWKYVTDAEVAGDVVFGRDYTVRSGKSLWTIDGMGTVLSRAGMFFVRKEKALPGQLTLEDVLGKVQDQLAEMAPDDGIRLLHVKGHLAAERWVEGQLVGTKKWVRGMAGVKRPAVGSVVRAMALDDCNGDVWAILPGTLTTTGGVW